MDKNDPLFVPSSLEDQKSWAAKVDGRDLDTAYYQLRKLATRRILLAGLQNAFEQLPTLDHVIIHFRGGTVKESIQAIDQDPNNTPKLHAKFDKMMAGVRKRMGQNTNVADTLQVFFGQGQVRKIHRHSPETIDLLFQDIHHWDEAIDARIEALALDRATPPAQRGKPGPRF